MYNPKKHRYGCTILRRTGTSSRSRTRTHINNKHILLQDKYCTIVTNLLLAYICSIILVLVVGRLIPESEKKLAHGK